MVPITNPSSPVLKASVWIQLCLLERILGVLLNLPTTTRGRPSQLPRYLLRNNGIGRAFFWALSDVAVKIRERDDSIAFADIGTDWMTETEVIERLLERLINEAGMCEQGCAAHSSQQSSEHSGSHSSPLLYRHMYFYLLLRTHLPMMTRTACTTDSASRHFVSTCICSTSGLDTDQARIALSDRSHGLCIHAARRMGELYLQQITGPSQGLFPMRVSDFMAFTAIAVLMLEQEGILRSSTSVGSFAATSFGDTNGNAKLLEDLIAMLRQTARQEGRAIASQAVKAVDSIHTALSTQAEPHSEVSSIRIPLLGTMRVTRRRRINSSASNLSTVQFPDPMDIIGRVPGPPPEGGHGYDGMADANMHGDQFDWVAEMMNTYDLGATSTQDALWLWDDDIPGKF